jgi:hypothetical protein
MNAFRKASLVFVVALVAVFALGAFQSSAEAGGHNHHGHNHHGHHFHHGHHHHVKYYPSHYWPTYDYVKPASYPVTYYDCYGRPYVVWQTSYSNYTNPIW